VFQLRESDRESSPRRPAPAQPELAARAGEAADVWLVCAECGARIADPEAQLEVNGAQAHTFINPAGIIFRVGCFREAPGARAVGEASEHWTWFAGFVWQAAICHGCGQHLGWFYRNPSASFVALILDRVAERGGPAASSA